MGRRTVTTVVFVVAISALSSACSNTNPTTPSNTTDNGQTSSNPALVSRLQITSMGLTDAGPSARGDWLYEARVYLRETGGVDVTITNLQIQVLLDSKVLGAARSTPMLSMTANSSRDTALVVAADTHVQVSALTTTVTVQFTDAKGNTGSINSSGSCAGCWDY